ncbi:sialidase family protein [Lentilactobacillus hilgardii]|uniref:sialidase family protein n=1 Tax=Lentilactobacillus hilgardii TaxID=1588 RepID=UPI003FA5AC4A
MVTIATKSMFTDTRQPNFLYGKGLLTTHSDDQHNGRLYATCEHYVNTIPAFPIFESTDMGQSWRHVSNVTDQVNGWGMRYQPFLYELPEKIGSLPAGILLCAGNSIPQDMSATKIDLYTSLDHAKSWQYLSTVVQGGTASVKGQKPVWEPFLTVIDHRLVCFFSDERDKKTHSQKLAHKTSRDGLQWGAEIDDVALDNPDARPGMATVSKMANGNYIMTFEMVVEGAVVINGERNRSNFKISKNGLDWRPGDSGTEFANGGSPYVAVLSDGRVVANSTGNELYVNDKNGDGKWTTVQTPMAGAYSRSLTPLGNSQVLIISAGPYAGPTAKADHELTSLVFNIPTG